MKDWGEPSEMMVRSGAHVGKRVRVYHDGPHYNPRTDAMDENWVLCVLPDGRVGSIELAALFYPMCSVEDLK